MVNPFFVAVIEQSPDAGTDVDRLKTIQGVAGVIIDDQEESKQKISSLVSGLGADYVIDQNLLSFKTVKVLLSPSLSQESLEYVRSEVLKSAKIDSINASDVKYPELASTMQSHPFYLYLKRMGDWGVVGVISLLWIISYWLLFDTFRARGYLIEKFQRKRLVAAKSMAAGLSIIYALFIGFGIWNQTLKFFDIIILFMIFSVVWTFMMKQWKWKPA